MLSTRAITAAQAGLAGQLRASGRAGAAVSAAFLAVPRHVFLPQVEPEQAYRDTAIVIKSDDHGLPVSSSTQPAMMAIMLEQLGLAAGQRVLEIGTGTGYNAAVIAAIIGAAGSVVTMDIEPDLVGQARANLAAAGVAGVTVIQGDGADGVPDLAPYDRIIVTAGAWDLAPRWLAQLGPGGRIVLPLSVRGIQLAVAFADAGDHWAGGPACRCGFIRMTGPTAGPESVIPLGPAPDPAGDGRPGLRVRVVDGPAPEARPLYAALAGAAAPVPGGLRAASAAALADLDLWLALTEPGLARINLMGRPEAGADSAERRIAGLMPLGGFARTGVPGSFAVAALAVPGEPPQPAAADIGVTIMGYGAGGAALAAHLAERAAVWDAAGRPGVGTLELRAYPAGTRPAVTDGVIIIDRPNTVLTAGWPAT